MVFNLSPSKLVFPVAIFDEISIRQRRIEMPWDQLRLPSRQDLIYRAFIPVFIFFVKSDPNFVSYIFQMLIYRSESVLSCMALLSFRVFSVCVEKAFLPAPPVRLNHVPARPAGWLAALLRDIRCWLLLTKLPLFQRDKRRKERV